MGSLFSLVGLGFMGALFSIASHGLPDKTPLIHFAPKPALLSARKSKDSDETEEISFRTLVESRCPSLFTQFHPIWWLSNGHFQTIYCVLGDFSKRDKMWYNRTYLRLGDGGAGVPITSPQLYSAGHTDDLRQAVFYIAHKYPNAPLLGLGFSLGANVLTRYLAEEGSSSRIISGCALACPWDLEQNNLGLLRTFLGKHVYSKGMGGNLQNLLRRHEKALQSDPEHRVTKAMPSALALRNPTLEKFDDTFTRVAGGSAPTFPFATAHDYYRWGSSHQVVQDIRVPFLAINAADDPVVRHVPMDGGGNGLVVMELTPSGGHLGWFQAGDGFVDRWTTKPVLEWLKLTGEDIVHRTKEPTRRLYIDDEGWLREEGTPLLGCKKVEGGGMFNGNGGEKGMLQGL
ncbi:hypothetical protein C0989_011420 [Termitomyces sp. Mn162]|nr:hypothetical protein C0989_011420 [Termitomyces sp. Mn162]